MIHVRELTKTYSDLRRGQFVALDGITFDAFPGEVFGLLGPNGAGKTTLLNLVTGQLRPTLGSIRVFGERPNNNPRFLAKIGYVVFAGKGLQPIPCLFQPAFAGSKALLHFG